MIDVDPDLEMQRLASDILNLSGTLRRDAEKLAQQAGQTQTRWQVMWWANTGRLSGPTIARRLGVTRQNVQRVADDLVHDGLATFEPNPDHKRSPILALNADGLAVLDQIQRSAGPRLLQCWAALGEDGVHTLRNLVEVFRLALESDHPPAEADRA